VEGLTVLQSSVTTVSTDNQECASPSQTDLALILGLAIGIPVAIILIVIIIVVVIIYKRKNSMERLRIEDSGMKPETPVNFDEKMKMGDNFQQESSQNNLTFVFPNDSDSKMPR